MSDRARSGYVRPGISRIEVLVGGIVLAVAGVLVLPTLGSGRVAERRAACLVNLGEIGKALTAYLNDSGQVWPYVSKLRSVQLHQPPWPTLPEVLEKYVAGRKDVFACPADRRELADDSPLRKEHGKRTTWWQTEGTSYEWMMGEGYGGRKVGEETLVKAKGFGMGRADMPLVAEFGAFHEGDGGGSFNTLNADLKPRTAKDNVRR